MSKELVKLHLKKGDVHIWYTQLSLWKNKAEEMRSLLSPQEVKRGERFVLPERENDFMIQRGIVRSMLSGYLGQKPEDITIFTSENGKPYIPGTNYQFNVSHSSDLLLFGISQDRLIGVDIQIIYSISPLERITEKILTSSEIKLLNSVPSKLQLDHFFTIWTAKEALIKATGQGFSWPPNQFSIYHFNENKISLNLAAEQIISTKKEWTIHELQLDSDYKAALAVESGFNEVIIDHISPENPY